MRICYTVKKVELEYYKTVELLDDTEVEIIKAIRTLGIKELTIKFDKNANIILIEELNSKDVKKLHAKVNSLSKKVVVTDIRMVFDEHGNLRLYQEKIQEKPIKTKLIK